MSDEEFETESRLGIEQVSLLFWREPGNQPANWDLSALPLCLLFRINNMRLSYPIKTYISNKDWDFFKTYNKHTVFLYLMLSSVCININSKYLHCRLLLRSYRYHTEDLPWTSSLFILFLNFRFILFRCLCVSRPTQILFPYTIVIYGLPIIYTYFLLYF